MNVAGNETEEKYNSQKNKIAFCTHIWPWLAVVGVSMSQLVCKWLVVSGPVKIAFGPFTTCHSVDTEYTATLGGSRWLFPGGKITAVFRITNWWEERGENTLSWLSSSTDLQTPEGEKGDCMHACRAVAAELSAWLTSVSAQINLSPSKTATVTSKANKLDFSSSLHSNIYIYIHTYTSPGMNTEIPATDATTHVGDSMVRGQAVSASYLTHGGCLAVPPPPQQVS